MTRVQFVRENKLFHVYNSLEKQVAGYRVEKIEDNIWAATFKDAKFTDRVLRTRAEAFMACSEHFDPTPSKLTFNEHAQLQYAIDNDGQVPFSDIVSDGKTGLSPSAAMTVLKYLLRRGLFEEKDSNLAITEAGKRAVEAYVPKVRKVRATSSKSSAETKYGPRPEWATPPTDLEILESKVRRWEGIYLDQCIDRRIHPYSPVAERKLNNSLAKFEAAKTKLAAFKAGETVDTTDETSEQD